MIFYLQLSLNSLGKGVTKKDHEDKQTFSKLQNAKKNCIFSHLDHFFFI
jgi:hypothetical protein